MTMRPGRVFRWAAGIAGVVLMLAGCGEKYVPLTEAQMARIDTRQALLDCCASQAGSFPPELVLSVERNSFWVAPAGRALKVRPSWLEDDIELHHAVLARARPLDVLLIANASRASGVVGGGTFGHLAIYIGTEAELRAMGLWSHPLIVPFQDDIRAGKVVIEALDKDVHLSGSPELFETDHIALLRPTSISASRRREAIVALFGDMGARFDFHFDVRDDSAIFCTELLERALPELGLPARAMYGREVILPDEIAAQTLAGVLPFELRLFIRGYPQGWRVQGAREMTALVLGTNM
ncbi:YiiX/YebB-like N1pC/P60 family cysteine hydrolase [Maritimibacter fusiformis]|uniref:Permuted papain-like amidase YaeF/Yiix C92 family enzyme n=1 Tax=Maritimibacter fusiformis TaxID=2603819 RepID=A0A5D0RME9_9RHOB|nr:YiiX/YebB-like N1pC/P60 family cysteine hydrolase [Maritimibacter fusiformis]TYB82837.1 hypothetical protein FVF75_01215 [Maritimibacter fusiformis]